MWLLPFTVSSVITLIPYPIGHPISSKCCPPHALSFCSSGVQRKVSGIPYVSTMTLWPLGNNALKIIIILQRTLLLFHISLPGHTNYPALGSAPIRSQPDQPSKVSVGSTWIVISLQMWVLRQLHSPWGQRRLFSTVFERTVFQSIRWMAAF